jgi:hypothetical protein
MSPRGDLTQKNIIRIATAVKTLILTKQTAKPEHVLQHLLALQFPA